MEGKHIDLDLTFILNFEVVLEMVERIKVELRVVFWVLNFDDVLAKKRLVGQQVFPVLRLDVQLFDRLK